MDINTQKEEFSFAYVQAIASAAAYAFQRATPPLDKVGVDAIITGLGAQGTMGFPLLYLQVKCTSRDVLDTNYVRYPLKVKNYEELRVENRYPPAILVVVLVPDRVDNWLNQSEEELCMKRCGYWGSLRGLPATQNQETVTVLLPRQNLLTVNALKSLMQRIATGEAL